MRLSHHNIESQNVGYGNTGFDGQLGFSDLYISVGDKHYPHALGAHAPSQLTFALPAGMQGFSAYVALNDTAEHNSIADFFVYADNELIAATHSVKLGDAPRLIEGEIYGARELRLVANTQHWPGCHTLWIDPIVTNHEQTVLHSVFGDINVTLGSSIEYCDTCIVVIITDGYEQMAEAMLASLWDNGGCKDATLLIITDANNTSCQQLATKFNAIVKYINRIPKDTYSIKSLAYSVARLVRANNYVIADVDMIVTGSINPLLSSIGVIPNGNILICKEQEVNSKSDLISGIDSRNHPYFGSPGDLKKLKVSYENAAHCPLFNGGLMAGTREAFFGLESAMRDLMPFAGYWERQEVFTDINLKVKWREQGVMNAALARTGKWSELSGIYNCQLAVSGNPFEIIDGLPHAMVDNQSATIIHFNGIQGREYYSHITHGYRDGNKKPFNTDSKNNTTEAIVLGAKLFRACYRTSASKAFADIDSFWEYQALWSTIWEEICSIKTPRVIDVNTFAMCAAAVSMRATELSSGNFDVVTESTAPEWFSTLLGNNLNTGDIELILVEMESLSKKYDIVFLDTHNNTRKLINLLNISKGIVSDEGSILLLDIQHPVNDVSVFLDKMRQDKWTDKLIFSHENIALYKLKKSPHKNEQSA